MGYLKHTDHDGTSWQLEIIDTLLPVPISFSGARHITSLSLDASDQIHIAYSDRQYLRYGTKLADGWDIQEVFDAGITGKKLGAQTLPGN